MSMKEPWWSAAAVTVCMVASGVVPHRAAVREADRVVYTTFRPGQWDIYRFTEPRHAPERLTTDPGLHYDPVVSPDGRWLVFCSEQRGSPDLYALDLRNGGKPRLLIDSNSLEDQAAFSPDGRSLAFVSTASGNADIYVIPFRPDRTLRMTDATNVTRHPGGDFRPAFSPDGGKLAFSSNRDSPVNDTRPTGRIRDGDIYVVTLSSGRIERLTDAAGWDGSPAWSANGRTIVFYSQRRTPSADRLTRTDGWVKGQAQIWAMNADGSNQHALTPDETLALSPEYLPNGRIVYSRKTRDGRWQIVSIRADGSDPRVESDDSENSYWEPTRGSGGDTIIVHGSATMGVPDGMTPPTILPDGGFLAAGAPFRRTLPDREIDLYPVRRFSAALHPLLDLLLTRKPLSPELLLSHLDGSGARALPFPDDRRNVATDAAWSKDGEWIAFAWGDAGSPGELPSRNGEIWKIRADGTSLRNLTPGAAGNNSHPSFSADGKRIVFRSGRSGQFDLYLMNADGSDVRALTSDAANDLFPVFSPASNEMAFVSNRHDPTSKLYEIYLMTVNSDGSPGSARRLTDDGVQKAHLAFSYDGKWILFSSEAGGVSDEEPLVQTVAFAGQMYGEMYALRLSDGVTVRLTENKWEEGIPAWEAPRRLR
jgi:Tol biopolymer transport system component